LATPAPEHTELDRAERVDDLQIGAAIGTDF
jgi:hypothetical protein